MPSKVKKPLKPSQIDRSPPACSPVTPVREPQTSTTDEALNRRHLALAAARFPHLISESAFCGIISNIEAPHTKGNHARIWLSEAAMMSSTLLPCSLVSVSLAPSGKQGLDGSPLHNFVEVYAARVNIGDSFLHKVGCYFAIASIYPSSEVQKNGVKLSWDLSCTMGFPSIGQALFIFPIGNLSSFCNESNRKSSCNLYLHQSKDLKLSLLPISCYERLPKSYHSIESESITNGHQNSESPRTPSSHPIPSAPLNTPLPLKKLHGSSFCVDPSPCMDMSSLKLAFSDKKMKELWEKCASRWVYGRFLLDGNLVRIPICDKILVFWVEGAKEPVTSSYIHDSISETKSDVLLHGDKVDASLDRKYDVLFVSGKTRVFLSDSLCIAGEITREVSFPVSDGSVSIISKEPRDMPKLGGFSKEFAALDEILKFSFINKDPLLRCTGVLIYGPPGTGKTTLVSSCVHQAGAQLLFVNGPEIVSPYYGETEQALHDIFASARKAAPAVVFIDELDAIAPSRKDGGEELSIRIVATLLNLMDEIEEYDGIIVIATTNRPDSIDPALRRPGRLDREIEIGVPSPVQRLDILHTLLSRMNHSLSCAEIESLAFVTHGFVGADLAALCNEAGKNLFRRLDRYDISERHLKDFHARAGALHKDIQGASVQEVKAPYNDDLNSLSSLVSDLCLSPSPIWSDNLQRVPGSNLKSCLNTSVEVDGKVFLEVTAEDFERSKMKVRPSAMREVMLEFPKVRWEDIGGQREIKKQLIEAVRWPQICPEAFERIGILPPKGLLMIGPPGCSKTLMARAVASEAKLNFLAVKGPELFNKFVGESEKAVRSLFAKAKANSPAIIFFDEIDGLAVTRGSENDGTSVGDRVLCQLLVEMDGLEQSSGCTVIAATNRPDKIDPALLRPGRFDRILDVQPPDIFDREEIFQIHTRDVPCSPDVSMKELASLTEGFTGADIKLACRDAAVAALEESFEISEISMRHFRIGIESVKPSAVGFYQKIAQQFRRLVDAGFK